jgi:hypothetical protein
MPVEPPSALGRTLTSITASTALRLNRRCRPIRTEGSSPRVAYSCTERTGICRYSATSLAVSTSPCVAPSRCGWPSGMPTARGPEVSGTPEFGGVAVATVGRAISSWCLLPGIGYSGPRARRGAAPAEEADFKVRSPTEVDREDLTAARSGVARPRDALAHRPVIRSPRNCRSSKPWRNPSKSRPGTSTARSLDRLDAHHSNRCAIAVCERGQIGVADAHESSPKGAPR